MRQGGIERTTRKRHLAEASAKPQIREGPRPGQAVSRKPCKCQFSLLTQPQLLLSLRMGLGLLIQQVGDVGPEKGSNRRLELELCAACAAVGILMGVSPMKQHRFEAFGGAHLQAGGNPLDGQGRFLVHPKTTNSPLTASTIRTVRTNLRFDPSPLLSVRSRVRVARARAGSMVRVYSSRTRQRR